MNGCDYVTKEDKFNTLKGFLGLSIYFIAAMTNLSSIILDIFNINYQNWTDTAIYTYLIIYQFMVVGIIIALFGKTYKKHFIDFKNNFKNYISNYIKYWFMTLGLMMLSNILIQMITSGIAPNEQAVRDTLQMEPLYTFIASVIIAPFLEESVFRLSIRKIVPNNKWLYIIISGISFGLLHVIGNISVWSDWLYLVPYSIPGLIFAYTLVKSDNIFVPISLHTIHNGVLITIQLLAML